MSDHQGELILYRTEDGRVELHLRIAGRLTKRQRLKAASCKRYLQERYKQPHIANSPFISVSCAGTTL